MVEKDVIICSYNCGGDMNCNEEAAKFADPPHLIYATGGSSEGFKTFAYQNLSNGSVLDNLLAKNLPSGIAPRRVMLASFSAGWGFSTIVMNQQKDRDRIDTALVMDGIHTSALDGWKSFAKLAGKGGINVPKLFMVHTEIDPRTFISTTKSNTQIIEHAKIMYPDPAGESVITVPDYVMFAKLDEPKKIYSQINKKWKTYEEDPLDNVEVVGNVARFGYKGTWPQDHIYNAWYAQKHFWHWIRDLWSDPGHGVFYREEAVA